MSRTPGGEQRLVARVVVAAAVRHRELGERARLGLDRVEARRPRGVADAGRERPDDLDVARGVAVGGHGAQRLRELDAVNGENDLAQGGSLRQRPVNEV
jgi:hypothetical protein